MHAYGVYCHLHSVYNMHLTVQISRAEAAVVQLSYTSCAACVQKLPQFLQALVELLLAAGVYPPEQAPQHVLINSYSKGAGISPHMDGPLYSSCVATITLAGPALMSFHEALPNGTQGQLAAEVCSTGSAYLHIVQEQVAAHLSECVGSAYPICVPCREARAAAYLVVFRP